MKPYNESQTFTDKTQGFSSNIQKLAQIGVQVLTLQPEEEPGFRTAVQAENFFARANVASIVTLTEQFPRSTGSPIAIQVALAIRHHRVPLPQCSLFQQYKQIQRLYLTLLIYNLRLAGHTCQGGRVGARLERTSLTSQ